MDEQNPRVTAAGVSGRGDDRMTTYDRAPLESPSRDASDVWGAHSLRADRNPATVDASSDTRTHELRTIVVRLQFPTPEAAAKAMAERRAGFESDCPSCGWRQAIAMEPTNLATVSPGD